MERGIVSDIGHIPGLADRQEFPVRIARRIGDELGMDLVEESTPPPDPGDGDGGEEKRGVGLARHLPGHPS
jgi:hypothetical protein